MHFGGNLNPTSRIEADGTKGQNNCVWQSLVAALKTSSVESPSECRFIQILHGLNVAHESTVEECDRPTKVIRSKLKTGPNCDCSCSHGTQHSREKQCT